MKIKDLPKIDRPREKLVAKGAENLKDSELLAILLRTGKTGKNVIEIASLSGMSQTICVALGKRTNIKMSSCP